MRCGSLIVVACFLPFGPTSVAEAEPSGQNSAPAQSPSHPVPQPAQEEIWRIQKRCASNCLYLLMKMNRKTVHYQDIERLIPVTENGANLADIRRCATSLGLATEVVKATPEYLARCCLPAIVHMEPEDTSGTMGHFVVLTVVGPDKVELIDGTTAIVDVIPRDKFNKQWSGFLLITGTPDGGPSQILYAGAALLGALSLGLAIATKHYHPRRDHTQ